MIEKDNFVDLIAESKTLIKKEDLFLDLLIDLRISKIDSKFIEYKNSNDETVFRYVKKKSLVYVYHDIWFILKNDLTYDETSQLIKNFLVEHLNWKVNKVYSAYYPPTK